MIFKKIKKFIGKKLRNYKKQQKRINTVASEAGWSKSQAKKALAKAKAMGMPEYRYIKNECWNLSDEEIISLNGFNNLFNVFSGKFFCQSGRKHTCQRFCHNNAVCANLFIFVNIIN